MDDFEDSFSDSELSSLSPVRKKKSTSKAAKEDGSKKKRGRPKLNPKKEINEKKNDDSDVEFMNEDVSSDMERVLRSGDSIDRICGRRPCSTSSDGFEYGLHHKGISYLHLEWVTKDELDLIEFKSPMYARFLKKVENSGEDPNKEILFISKENQTVESILDCVDAIIEINPKLYFTGWRMLSMDEVIPDGTKIYNLPQPWRERLVLKKKDNDKPDEDSIINPYLSFKKSIKKYIPNDETKQIPTESGSIFMYEKLYLVKWMEMSFGEATWERFCDINVQEKVNQFIELNTIPPQIADHYSDYLPENYMSIYEKDHDLSLFEPTVAPIPVETEEKKHKLKIRGRPRVNKPPPKPRNKHHLRNCVDPIAPPFDKAEGKARGFRPPLAGTWRRVLNIVMVLSNCRQLDLATFCGFAQSSLSLWVNGKYTGDTKMLLGKFKKWVEKTYPELYAIANQYGKDVGTGFQTACYPWLSKYISDHPDLGLDESDVCFLLSLESKDGVAGKVPQPIYQEIPVEKKESSQETYYNTVVIPSMKLEESEFDYNSSMEYVKSFGPIGTCCLMTEEFCEAEEQDRTLVFQVYGPQSTELPPIDEEFSNSKEQNKKNPILPSCIAAPMSDSILCSYIQPVSLDEVKEVCEAGQDISISLNDVMKTTIYSDKSIHPQGYNLRNNIVGVIDNTFASFNAIKTHATMLKANNRMEIENAHILSNVAVNIAPLNSRLNFTFAPPRILTKEDARILENRRHRRVERRKEILEFEELEDEELMLESDTEEKEKPPVKPDPVRPSTKMILAGRAIAKAYQDSLQRKQMTVFDLFQILFKPSRYNKPVTLLPPPPVSVLNPVFRPYTQSPVYRDGRELRDYQVVSLNWMVEKWRANEGAILGDEMGLGKTIQVISLLHHYIYTEHQEGPYLVISPLSTLKNWYREFLSWSTIRVCLYHTDGRGKGKDEREFIRHYNWYYKTLPAKSLYKFNVLLTTYEIVMKDWGVLGEIKWKGCVMDEAHRMRNNNCKFIQFISGIKTEHKLLLTGTPLQNNTNELWPLLNFIDVREAGSQSNFNEEFGDLHSKDQVDRLRDLLNSCMLRRVKEDVEKSIPKKQETIVEVELTMTQKQYYKAIYERNRSFLYKGCKKSDIPSLMHVETQLRKVCNHPFLIKGVREKEELLKAEALNNTTESNDMSLDALAARQRKNDIPSIVSCSGKMVLIDKLLPKLQAEGHRVLIFSQFVMMLDILEEYCILRNFKVVRIDGQMKGSDRQQAIDEFCREDSEYFIFLLSTRAGGLGINLTAADTVIIYDSDWNPQNDSQATARCHRIGQKQEVTIYRLLTRHTYEMEMFDRASRKLAIETVVLRESALRDDDGEQEDEPEEEGELGEEGEPGEEDKEQIALEKEEDGEGMEVPDKLEEEPEKSEEPDKPEEEPDKPEEEPDKPEEPEKMEEEPEKMECGDEPDKPEEEMEEMEEEGEKPVEDGEDSVKNELEMEMDDSDVYIESESDLSEITIKTDIRSSVTEKSEKDDNDNNNEYNIPEAPYLPKKKKRGRKPTKPRTIEDELNPYKRSKNEVEAMLRRGLYNCLMENAAQSVDFFDADIGTILKKNTRSDGTVSEQTQEEDKQLGTSVERGGTVYSKRLFNPETDTQQIDLNDPEFWEKMLDSANADMLWQRLQDTKLMQDAASVKAWMRDLEKLVRDLCEEQEEIADSEFLQHEIDTTTKILTTASNMVTVFGRHACTLMLNWIDELESSRFKRRTPKRQEEVVPKVTKPQAVSANICSYCLKEESDAPGMQLVKCSGRCERSYHACCIGLKNAPSKWKCYDCTSKKHECMICHKKGKEGDIINKGKKRLYTFYEQWLRFNDIASYINTFGSGVVIESNRDKYMIDEPVIKCIQHKCGCFYHMSCVKESTGFTLYDQHPCAFRCPHHYCAICGTVANNNPLLVCAKCSHAYHPNCIKGQPYKHLYKKYILCSEHMNDPDIQPKPLRSNRRSKKREIDIDSLRSTRSLKRQHDKDTQYGWGAQSDQEQEEAVSVKKEKEEIEEISEVVTATAEDNDFEL